MTGQAPAGLAPGALGAAFAAHAGQTDKAGAASVGHVVRVAAAPERRESADA